mmetsp:Transcript_2350/g.6273  ORF Transcript_2350/g.6273 Transcript_2350/m.6273 type:complete len:255 (+) Transcript_2350:3-767(+)
MMFDNLWRTPTSSQFVGALAVTTVVLVFTSVVMTQKPPWMVGKEASLVKGGRLDPPWARESGSTSSSQDERKSARWQSLASVAGNPTADQGKLAVEQAAAHPGGLQHLDDYYVPILSSGARPDAPSKASPTQDVDKQVPAARTQSMYPLIGGFSDPVESNKNAPNALRNELAKADLNNQGVETTSGGHGRNEAAVIRGYKEVANVDAGFKSNPLDPGESTSWAMYVAVFLVLIALVMLLAHYMLPQGALYKSFW